MIIGSHFPKKKKNENMRDCLSQVDLKLILMDPGQNPNIFRFNSLETNIDPKLSGNLGSDMG